jgi:hypothetical protein
MSVTLASQIADHILPPCRKSHGSAVKTARVVNQRWGSILSTVKCIALAIVAVGALAAVPASAHYKVLYSFCNDCAEGSYPTSLIADSRGNLFGTTSGGGIQNCGDETPYGCGTVFELKRKKGGGYSYTALYAFQNGSDGAFPSGPLVIDTAGNLYGTAVQGGGANWGDVFELVHQNGAWSLKVLYSFCTSASCPDGAQPEAGLTYAGQQTGKPYDGTSPLFGTTLVGGQGQSFDSGVAFELQPQSGSWSYKVIYDFCSMVNCADGGDPEAPLLEDASGNLYGTWMTYGGGVFEISPANGGWRETALHTFCSATPCPDGWSPAGDGLALDSSGTLYGLTGQGGNEPCSYNQYGCGVAYQLTLNGTTWQETVLHAFCGPKKTDCSDGAIPADTPIFDSGGNEFGTAQDGGGSAESGTLFERSGSKFQILHRFCNKGGGCADGAYPGGNLVLGAGSAIFGTALAGGANDGGVVYEYAP